MWSIQHNEDSFRSSVRADDGPITYGSHLEKSFMERSTSDLCSWTGVGILFNFGIRVSWVMSTVINIVA